MAKNNIAAIEFALEHGLYDTRKMAAKYLGNVSSKKSIALLENAIDDEVQIVSEAAMNALEAIGCSHCTVKIEEKKPTGSSVLKTLRKTE